MALGWNYASSPITVVGTATTSTILYSDMVALTDGYATSAFGYIPCGNSPSKVNLYIVYSMAVGETGNSLDFIVEGSPNITRERGNYRFLNESASGGTSTLTRREFTIVGVAAGTISFELPLDIQDKLLKVSFKESGGVGTVGRVHCQAVLFGSK